MRVTLISPLTTGIDTKDYTGTKGAVTINGGTADTLTAFDNIKGGDGADDSMTVLLSGTAMPGQVTLKNIESITLNTTGAGFTVDSTGFTGVKSLTVGDSGTGAVSVTASDLPPTSRTNLNSRKSVTMENDGYEEEQIQRRTNHWVHQAG